MEIKPEDLSAIGDKIRDIINLIKVKQEEEVEGMTQKISDEAAQELIAQLEELSTLVGQAGGGVVETKPEE